MMSIFRMTVESWFLVNVHLFISCERRQSSMTVMRVSWKAFYDLTVPILSPASLTARLAGLLTMQSLFAIFSILRYSSSSCHCYTDFESQDRLV